MANPKDLPRDIGGFIRDLRRNAKISLRQLADQAGVSNPYLSQVERGLRKPSAEVLQQLASALRVSTPVMYLRAGLLDDKEGHGVLASIAADPDLTMPQKQSLSQIYETFRRENARQAETAPPTEAPAPTAAPTEAAAPTAGPTPTPTPPAAGVDGGAAVDDVLESVARTEAGTAPAPNVSQPAKRTARKAARKTAPAVEEE
ncbi:helix-turn-helix transcriptional regulator [Micromonospora sp. NPDC049523]|uniref:helix-turn-helix domain-containing protein n=1 Tax=Micromonospora sp. NPDC049523 TaxID=3155921 RepID=UPI00342DF54A